MVRPSLSQVPLGVAAALAILLGGASSANAQADIREIFSNDRFYEANGILQAHGDVPFVADVWVLPGAADSARALLGVGLSNSSLKFNRLPEGEWRATYQVVLQLEPERGPDIEQRWEKSVDVPTFDETLLTGETIVFQSEIPVTPGKYRVRVTVMDLTSEDLSRANGSIEVPDLGPTVMAEPVLLRRLDRDGAEVSFVVHPSHSFPAPPEQIEFMVSGLSPAEPLVARAVLIDPRADEPEQILATWSDTLMPGAEGQVGYGAIDNAARFGEYRLDVVLVDASGTEVARSSTPLVIAGSAAWVSENWKEALSVLRYQATDKEMDILEDIDDNADRIEAWACFWRMRDPLPTTAVNEEMQDYFSRLDTANKTWKSALRPGYLSDRGRVYITLGPPDDVQSNPLPFGQHPFEIWTYQRDRQFQLVFVDRIGFNNYQLETVGTYQREMSAIERRKRNFLERRASVCPLLAPAFPSS